MWRRRMGSIVHVDRGILTSILKSHSVLWHAENDDMCTRNVMISFPSVKTLSSNVFDINWRKSIKHFFLKMQRKCLLKRVAYQMYKWDFCFQRYFTLCNEQNPTCSCFDVYCQHGLKKCYIRKTNLSFVLR